MLKYKPEQLLSLYKRLPDQLRASICSDDTAQIIQEMAKKHNLSQEKTSLMVDLISEVLFGLLPPSEFEKSLQQELGMDTAIAKKINFEAYRLIFFPIKEALETLYETKITPIAPAKTSESISEQEKEPEKSKTAKRKRKDVYLESLE